MTTWFRLSALGALIYGLVIPVVLAQTEPDHGHASAAHAQHRMAVSSGGGVADTPLPTLPGQDAFGAIQEIVRLLEADPNTDWSKVNLTTLREHLIDMNEVTLHAAAQEQRRDDGLDVIVTGEGRTLDAIRRMLPAHASELNHLNGWRAGTEKLPNGVRLVVTSDVPHEVVHIQGLGFIGLMASGNHHQLHHLAMAQGEFHP